MTLSNIINYYRSLGYKLNIKFKNESSFMKFLNFFIKPFTKNFMTNFVTTIGNTIYFPDKTWLESNNVELTSIVAHEMIHIIDRQRLNLIFSFIYLFPQVMAFFSILSFLAFINLNWLFCLLFLLFLLPIPSPGRAWAELRGYSMSMYFMGIAAIKLNKSFDHLGYISWVTDNFFCGSNYYFMWPFKKYVYNKLLTSYNLNLGMLDKNLFQLYYDTYKYIEKVGE